MRDLRGIRTAAPAGGPRRRWSWRPSPCWTGWASPTPGCPTSPADTIADCADVVSEALGISICKNLFLCNRQKTEFYLLTMPGDKPFQTKVLSHQLGTTRLSFAPPELMESMLRCTPGSASVLGLAYDTDARVRLVMDREVHDAEWFGCHPCKNDASLRLRTEDLLRVFLPHTGHDVTVVDL